MAQALWGCSPGCGLPGCSASQHRAQLKFLPSHLLQSAPDPSQEMQAQVAEKQKPWLRTQPSPPFRMRPSHPTPQPPAGAYSRVPHSHPLLMHTHTHTQQARSCRVRDPHAQPRSSLSISPTRLPWTRSKLPHLCAPAASSSRGRRLRLLSTPRGRHCSADCAWPCPFCDPMATACQAPLSTFMEFSRQEHCSALPCASPGDLSDSGFEPATLSSPALAGGFFHCAPWEATTLLE